MRNDFEEQHQKMVDAQNKFHAEHGIVDIANANLEAYLADATFENRNTVSDDAVKMNLTYLHDIGEKEFSHYSESALKEIAAMRAEFSSKFVQDSLKDKDSNVQFHIHVQSLSEFDSHFSNSKNLEKYVDSKLASLDGRIGSMEAKREVIKQVVKDDGLSL